MLWTILLVPAVLAIAFLVVAALQPAAFRYERHLAIAAPASVLFGWVNDLHRFQEWSPWARIDPAVKNTFTGPAAGVGAALAWDGNSKVGAGSMTVTESRPSDLVRLRLEFLRPFRATHTAEFTFQTEGAQTLVSWSMTGRNNFPAKAFGLFANLDRMVGRDFEKGLASLKALAETRPMN